MEKRVWYLIKKTIQASHLTNFEYKIQQKLV